MILTVEGSGFHAEHRTQSVYRRPIPNYMEITRFISLLYVIIRETNVLVDIRAGVAGFGPAYPTPKPVYYHYTTHPVLA